MTRLLLTAVVAAGLVGAPPQPTGATGSAAPPVVLDLQPQARIHGAGVEEFLHVVGAADVNGDEATDLMLARYVRPRATNWEVHYQLAAGRPDWPAALAREADPRAVEVRVPQGQRVLPDKPNTYLLVPPFADMNRDGRADIGIYQLVARGSAFGIRLGVFYGRPTLWPAIDIAADTPDLAVGHPNVSGAPGTLQRTPVPDHVLSGDFDGDGAPDLLVVACGLRGSRYARGNESAWLLYKSGRLGLRDVDMAQRQPDAILYGQPDDGLVCSGDYEHDLAVRPAPYAVADLDGDGRDDLLATGWDQRRRKAEVRLILSPESWPATGEIEDLAAATIASSGTTGASVHAPRILPDLDGDGLPEITVNATHIWLGAGTPQGAVTLDSAALVFADAVIAGSFDVNGDGKTDLVIETRRRNAQEGLEYRILKGPVELRGEHSPRRDQALGDYVLRLPAQPVSDYASSLWTGDFNGDGMADLAMSFPSQSSPARVRAAGVTELYLGPLVPGDIVVPPPSVPRSPCPDPWEPDDLPGHAAALTPNQPQQRNFDLAGDMDYVRFSAPPGRFVLATSDLDRRTDTRLVLASAGGQPLAVNDDARGRGAASEIQWLNPDGGDYLAFVHDVDPRAGGCDRTYTLSLVR